MPILKIRKEVFIMTKSQELNPSQRFSRTVELHQLAMDFRRTGLIDPTRWSPDVISGLGMTLSRLAKVDMQTAKAVAKQSADWAIQSLGK
jgi:hypothetical protein